MGYITAAKLFFSSLNPKAYLYIFITLLVITIGAYGTFKYFGAVSDASDAKTQIIQLTEKVSKKESDIKDLDQQVRFLDASVKSKDGTIELLRGQIMLANDLRSKTEAEKSAAEQKYKDIYAKHKSEKDSTISPKLAKILNDLEKDQ